MKVKQAILLSMMLIDFAHGMEETANQEQEKLSSSSMHQVRLSTIELDTNLTYQIDRKCTENPQRFLKLDNGLEKPVLQQFRQQAYEVFQNRQVYFREQKEFLELLLQKAKNQDNTSLQTIHPFFKNYTDEEILKILNSSISTYNQSIENADNGLCLIQDKSQTVDTFFRKFICTRMMTLVDRSNRRNSGINLPSTKKAEFDNIDDYEKFMSLEAIMNFRIYDEILQALFPYISQECFISCNELTHEKTNIKQDLALMQFLANEIQVPFDPDTTSSMRTLEGTVQSVFDANTRKYVERVIPTIPKERQELYENLYQSLEKTNIDMSFIPLHIKEFETRRQARKAKAKRKAKMKNELKEKNAKKKMSQPESSLPQMPSDNSKFREVNKIVEVLSPAEVSSQATYVEFNKAASNLKPTKPQGGWSLKDQLRNAQAKEKQQDILAPRNDNQLKTKFEPNEPINLTSGQHRTLQEILDAIPYSVTFNQVSDLLEAIGIKVARNGGSHAHINTPGHNIKTLVDIHYGWTDKFGRATMESLRELMINLSLDKEENIRKL